MWGVRRGGRGLGRWVRDGSPTGGFPAFDPASMPAMDPWALHVGPCERQVEIYNGFSPCRTAKRWIFQPLARGGVVSLATQLRNGLFVRAKLSIDRHETRTTYEAGLLEKRRHLESQGAGVPSF